MGFFMNKDQDNNNSYVVVIGAANIDIGGTPTNPLIPADSNPGRIAINYGGVARNIAHNLCLLGVPVKLVTAIGGDVLGEDMIRDCEKIGMDTSCILRVADETSSMYLFINDEKGEMELAIDHMTVCGKITPEYINSLKDVINGASAVVMDANVPFDSFLELKKICKVPIYIDPVSTALAERVKPGLDGIDAIKPNRLEAEHLTGMTIQTEADYRAAASAIIDMGVRRVFMSMGPEGMIAADKNNMYIVGEYPTEVVCTTGAGDSAAAAIVWASTVIADDETLVTAAKAANVVASMTVSVHETINKDISHQSALEAMLEGDMRVREI